MASNRFEKFENENTKKLKKILANEKLDLFGAVGLLQAGADVNTTNTNSESLLHLVVKADLELSEKTHKNSTAYDKYIEDLVKTFGANVDVSKEMNMTPLQYTMNSMTNINIEKVVNISMLLVSLGANPNAKAKNGNDLMFVLKEKKKSLNHAIEELKKTKTGFFSLTMLNNKLVHIEKYIDDLSRKIEEYNNRHKLTSQTATLFGDVQPHKRETTQSNFPARKV